MPSIGNESGRTPRRLLSDWGANKKRGWKGRGRRLYGVCTTAWTKFQESAYFYIRNSHRNICYCKFRWDVTRLLWFFRISKTAMGNSTIRIAIFFSAKLCRINIYYNCAEIKIRKMGNNIDKKYRQKRNQSLKRDDPITAVSMIFFSCSRAFLALLHFTPNAGGDTMPEYLDHMNVLGRYEGLETGDHTEGIEVMKRFLPFAASREKEKKRGRGGAEKDSVYIDENWFTAEQSNTEHYPGNKYTNVHDRVRGYMWDRQDGVSGAGRYERGSAIAANRPLFVSPRSPASLTTFAFFLSFNVCTLSILPVISPASYHRYRYRHRLLIDTRVSFLSCRFFEKKYNFLRDQWEQED